MHLVEVMKEPTKWANKTIDVIVVEPLNGPKTLENLRQATYGQVPVSLVDHRGSDLALVPREWTPESPTRYRTGFDRVLTSPLHVTGELLEDRELSRKGHPSWVLRVKTIEAATLEPPVRVNTIEELARYDRRAVIYEGTYTAGFERSFLDGKIWLSVYDAATSAKVPRNDKVPRRVRATGIVFAQPGQRYGHMGSGLYELIATELEDLGALDGADR